jgi:Protein of unknown function (DUF2949)
MENSTCKLIDFLKDNLQLPTDYINLALKQAKKTPNFLPIILWQYGLVSLTQLDQIFDWLHGPRHTSKNIHVIIS